MQIFTCRNGCLGNPPPCKALSGYAKNFFDKYLRFCTVANSRSGNHLKYFTNISDDFRFMIKFYNLFSACGLNSEIFLNLQGKSPVFCVQNRKYLSSFKKLLWTPVTGRLPDCMAEQRSDSMPDCYSSIKEFFCRLLYCLADAPCSLINYSSVTST